jgi:hypothetical protein
MNEIFIGGICCKIQPQECEEGASIKKNWVRISINEQPAPLKTLCFTWQNLTKEVF